MSTQLTLGVQLRETATFQNYYVSPENALIISTLQKTLHGEGEPYIYLWGSSGVGCSHLLQACCHEMGERGLASLYLPITSEILQSTFDISEGLEMLSLICIDDIEGMGGNAAWEESMFHLFNRLYAQQIPLIVSAHCAPTQLPIHLPDLKSRFSYGISFQLKNLTDEEKLKALQLRAHQRGFELSESVGKYLLTRAPRSMTDLFTLLERLDQLSLQEQRRLTIPFVKQVL